MVIFEPINARLVIANGYFLVFYVMQLRIIASSNQLLFHSLKYKKLHIHG